MSLRKVYGGNPSGREPLCGTCTKARIIQGYAESECIVFCCGVYPVTRVPFIVSQCTMYQDKRVPTVVQMAQIAWDLRSNSPVHTAGFVAHPIPANRDRSRKEKPEDVAAVIADSNDE